MTNESNDIEEVVKVKQTSLECGPGNDLKKTYLELQVFVGQSDWIRKWGVQIRYCDLKYISNEKMEIEGHQKE